MKRALFIVKRRANPKLAAIVAYNEVSGRKGKVIASEPLKDDFNSDDLSAAASRLLLLADGYDVILPEGMTMHTQQQVQEPKKHRAKLQLVHSVADGAIFGEGTNTPPRLAEPAIDPFAAHYDLCSLPMDPEDMVKAIGAYTELKGIAEKEIPPENGDIDWEGELSGLDCVLDSPQECLDIIKRGEGITNFDVEIWLPWLGELIDDDTQLDILDDAQRDALAGFFDGEVSASDMGDHPIAKAIDGFAEMVARQRALRDKAFARANLAYMKRPHVYWSLMSGVPNPGPAPTPWMLEWEDLNKRYESVPKGSQELWAYFEPADESDLAGPDGAYMYRFSAVWVSVNPLGVATLIASASGYFLPLYNGEFYLHENSVSYVCDVNCADGETFSEAIADFVASEGFETIPEFIDYSAMNCEGPGPGIAMAWIRIPKGNFHRTKSERNITEDFLYGLSKLLEEGSDKSYTNPKYHRPPFSDDEFEQEEIDDDWVDTRYDETGPGQAPIRLFIIPITGMSEEISEAKSREEKKRELSAIRVRRARHFRECHKDGDFGFFVRTMSAD